MGPSAAAEEQHLITLTSWHGFYRGRKEANRGGVTASALNNTIQHLKAATISKAYLH